ncbi:MAG TPA: helix-turn-helix domain-containing protein [Anaeromyxobacter sp.]
MARPARAGAHDALLEAARDEFAARGLERARIEDISRRAGVSKGAFYLHFTTKEDAFREIVSRFLGALDDHALRRDELEDLVQRDGAAGDPHALSRHIEAECAIDVDLLELLWRNRQILAAVDGASRPLYRELVGDFRRKMRALVSRRMGDGVCGDARVRPDIPPDVVADIVVGTYEDFARRMIDMKVKPDLEAWARAMLLVLYEGILERPAAARRPGRRRPRLRSVR